MLCCLDSPWRLSAAQNSLLALSSPISSFWIGNIASEFDVLLKKIEAVAQVNSEIVEKIRERKTQRRLKYSLHYHEATKQFVAEEILDEFDGICAHDFNFLSFFYFCSISDRPIPFLFARAKKSATGLFSQRR